MIELYSYDFSEFSDDKWANNLPVQSFWKKIINEYTNEKYDTFTIEEENVVGFTFCDLAN